MRVSGWRALAPVLALGVGLAARPAAAQDVTFTTGPQGGLWAPLGAALRDIWQSSVPGLTVHVLPGAGIANIRAIEEGNAQLGFAHSITAVDALAGAEPFGRPHQSVCNLASLYPQFVQTVVIASSGIVAVKELSGKALTTLPRGSTSETAAAHVLEANGLTYADMKVSFVPAAESITQMQDGQADAWVVGTSIPARGILGLAAKRDVRVLDLAESFPAVKRLNSGYTLRTIPAGTYPKQTEDVRVASYTTHLIGSCALPAPLVRAILKAMLQNVAALAALGSAMTGLDVRLMAEHVGVPFHPGAAEFYREQGVGGR